MNSCTGIAQMSDALLQNCSDTIAVGNEGRFAGIVDAETCQLPGCKPAERYSYVPKK
jgi:hypothetical protein